MRLSCACIAPFLLAALAGCGETGLPKAKVAGTVTLDGKPLETANILFVSADNTTTTTALTIADGAYGGEVAIGKMLVRISSLKAVGKEKAYDTPDSPLRDIYEEQVPARYNANTELSAEIKAGEQKLDFPLKTQ